MSQSIDFMDFPYFRVSYVHPDVANLTQLLYPSLIDRILGEVEFVSEDTNPLPPRFGACRTIKREIYSHKHRSGIKSQFVFLALGNPTMVLKLLSRRRLSRLTYTTLCGNPACIHPLHLMCEQDPELFPTPPTPRLRSKSRLEDDWLTLPEMAWLKYKMRTSYAPELEDIISLVQQVTQVSYSTLVRTWNTSLDLNRRGWYETFVVKTKRRR